MQIRHMAALAVICAAASLGSARAAVSTDNFLVRNTGDLVDLCSAANTDTLYTAAVNFCHGFAVGVFRVLQEEDQARASGRLFCLPQQAPSRTRRHRCVRQLGTGRQSSPAATGR